MPTCSMLGLSLLATCFLCGVRAEVYSFDGEEVPLPWALRSQRVFFVYGEGDTVGSFKGGAQVTFQNVGFKLGAKHSGNETRTQLEKNRNLMVGLLPYEIFREQVNPKHFCNSAGDFVIEPKAGQEQASASKSLVSHRVPYLEDNAESLAVDKEQNISKTGVYLLFFVNCGPIQGDTTLTGSISIQNVWGHLSPLDFFKEHFYGFLAAIYVLVNLVWLALALRWWKQLYPFQKGLAMTSLLVTLEAALWFAYFTVQNAWGVEYEYMRLLLETMSGYKLCMLLQMVLRLEDGVSDKSLDDLAAPDQKSSICLVSFLLFFVHKRITMHYWHTKLLKTSFILLGCMPVMGIGCILSIVALRSSVTVKLDEQQQALLAKTRGVVVLALVVGLLVGATQILDPILAWDRPYSWKFHFVVCDVLPQVGFFLGFLLLLLVWCPAERTQGYKYDAAAVHEGAVVGKEEGVWTDEDFEEEVAAAANTRVPQAGSQESSALE